MSERKASLRGKRLEKKLMTALCCLIVTLALVSCSERITNPLTPGSGLFRHDVVIKEDTLYASSDTTFLRRIAPGAASFLPHNFVGKNGTTRAYALVLFALPARDTIKVLSAKLKLHFVTRLGDSLATFGFGLRKITRAWNFQTLKWTDIDSAFFESSSRGDYASTIQPDSQQVSMNVDTAFVREWHRTGSTPFGFILIPSPSTTVIRGFGGFDADSLKFRPTLEVIASNTSGTVFDTVKYQAGNDTYVADGEPFPMNPQRIYTQGGIAYQSRLKFDVARLPRGATISTAELSLESDPSLTRISRFTQSPQPSVHALFSDDSTNYETFVFANGSKVTGANTYTFDVRRQVQLWTNGINYGLVLRQPTENEYNALELFVFYSNDASTPALRPRIRVKYAVFQN